MFLSGVIALPLASIADPLLGQHHCRQATARLPCQGAYVIIHDPSGETQATVLLPSDKENRTVC
jgi:hypothetical protein